MKISVGTYHSESYGVTREMCCMASLGKKDVH
jgi:hypothetical protein